MLSNKNRFHQQQNHKNRNTERYSTDRRKMMTIKSAVNKEINLNTRRLQKTMIRQTDHLVNNNY